MAVSVRARNLLRRIADSEDEELVHETPGGWWVDSHCVNGRDATELLRYCLIHLDWSAREGRYEIFSINEDGRGVLKRADYEPSIITALRQQITKAGN